MYLVALAKTKYLKKFGINAVLKYIVADVKKLVNHFPLQ